MRRNILLQYAHGEQRGAGQCHSRRSKPGHAVRPARSYDRRLDMVDVAQDIDLTHTETIGSVNALESSGLIAAVRAAQILAL
jgi:hypothetical protein